MLVEKTKKAIGRLFNRSASNGVKSRKSSLRKLIHENLEDRRVMTAIPLTAVNVPYLQNFDSLISTGISEDVTSGNNADGAASNGFFSDASALRGWGFSETGSSNNKTYGTTDGSGVNLSGNTYSAGAVDSAERAFASLNSGSNTPTIGASFVNNTGTTINSLAISYTGEQWRLGTSGRQDKLQFEYSTDATNLASGTWTSFSNLDFLAPITSGTAGGSLDGNAAANKVSYNQVIPGLSVANNTKIWIRWKTFDASGADDVLGIDNFSLTPNPTAPGVSITPTGADTRVHEDASAVNASDDYSIVLQTAPTSNVTVNITRNSAQLNVSTTSVTFTPGNWNIPQTVTISAVNDTIVEGTDTSVITHSIAPGSAAAYLGVVIPSLTVTIGDNEVPIGSAIPLTGSPYSQNFNTLASTGTSSEIADGMLTGTLKGWAFAESSSAANTTYGTDDGGLNSGNTYSYGAEGDTERAFGSLFSSSLDSIIGALFVNNTGAPIASLDISYFGEQWRLGAIREADSLNFQFSTDAYSLTTGTWTNFDDLDFTAPQTSGTVGALNGNDAANRSQVEGLIPSLNIPVNGTFWVRWVGVNVSDADDGLAIDDFTISTAAQAAPGVTIGQTGAGTNVEEAGTADEYTIVLQSQPTSNVTVNISPNAQVNTNASSIIFTPSNWNTPRTITINAVNDTVYEGTHTGVISHTVVSSDPGYNGLAVDSLTVAVTDNEAPVAFAIPLTGGTYTQNFDSLINSGTSSEITDGLLTGGTQGWAFHEEGAAGNTTYAANNGGSGTGNTYSYGATDATDRAFGGLYSGQNNPTIGAIFVNNTGAPITTLDIDYVGEQWRLGTSGRNDFTNFQYSLDAFSLTSGTWIDADQLDWIAPQFQGTVGALDGNAAANRVQVSDSITGLNIPAGATFWIRFANQDVTGADDGLAIDDFSISTGTPANTAPTISAIADQSIAANGSTGPIAFTVGDAQTPAASLVVTAVSTNTALVPVANIVFGGSGANRTVNVTPVAGQFGASTITLTVSDGTLTSTEVFVVNVSAPVVAPKVESVVFGDNTAQRSMVKSITVTFDKVVTIDTNAFELRRRVGSTLTAIPASELAIGVSTATVAGKTVATLTFTGSSIVGGSLSDGNYHLTVLSNRVHAGGVDLDGDGVGGAGGNYVKGAAAADNFFRLFGDTNGNRNVNVVEFGQFRAANGSTPANSNYRAYFDYQSNNAINILDFGQFRSRVGTTLPG